MNTVIFGNCQGFGLAFFMCKAGFSGRIEVFENYKLILKEQTPEGCRDAASKCDLFICQPTPEHKYGELSADHYINEVIPKSARVITFAYLFNSGFHPLIENGDDFIGRADMPAHYWRLPLPELRELYDEGSIDFGLWPRLLTCAAEQAKREQACDIRLSDYIVDHRNVPLFLNFNHPSSILFAQLARDVLSIIYERQADPIPVHDLNEAKLPCDLPLSRYVVDEYGMQVSPHPSAHEHYRVRLAQAWNKAQKVRP